MLQNKKDRGLLHLVTFFNLLRICITKNDGLQNTPWKCLQTVNNRLHAPLVSFFQNSFLALLWFVECGRGRGLTEDQDFTKPIIPCSPTQVCFMTMQEGINLLFFPFLICIYFKNIIMGKACYCFADGFATLCASIFSAFAVNFLLHSCVALQ